MTALAWPTLPVGVLDGERSVTEDTITTLHTAAESLITQPVESQFPEEALGATTHNGSNLLFGLVPVSPIDTDFGTVNLVMLLEVKLASAGSDTIGFQAYDLVAAAVIGSEVITAAITSTVYVDLVVTIPASSFVSKLNDSNIWISARQVTAGAPTPAVRCEYLATRWERVA